MSCSHAVVASVKKQRAHVTGRAIDAILFNYEVKVLT